MWEPRLQAGERAVACVVYGVCTTANHIKSKCLVLFACDLRNEFNSLFYLSCDATFSPQNNALQKIPNQASYHQFSILPILKIQLMRLKLSYLSLVYYAYLERWNWLILLLKRCNRKTMMCVKTITTYTVWMCHRFFFIRNNYYSVCWFSIKLKWFATSPLKAPNAVQTLYYCVSTHVDRVKISS